LSNCFYHDLFGYWALFGYWCLVIGHCLVIGYSGLPPPYQVRGRNDRKEGDSLPSYGIEEEVFVTEPSLPSLRSLYYLARLLWKDPYCNYFYTHSNLAHFPDVKTGLMVGVEITTRPCETTEDLLSELRSCRKEFSAVCDGLIVPMGCLINLGARSKTSGLHIHIGEAKNKNVVYENIAYFLPLLSLLTVSSPYFDNRYFGQSARIYHSTFIGPIKEDRYNRFQDIIISRRLKTIELRIFDPVWDINRIEILLRVIEKIVSLDRILNLDRKAYGRLRHQAAVYGFNGEGLPPLYQELNEIYPLPKELFSRTVSDSISDYYRQNGLVKIYSALDNAYRCGIFKAQKINPHSRLKLPSILMGVFGYWLPRLPYNLWKLLRES
jgi:hypothetical protein